MAQASFNQGLTVRGASAASSCFTATDSDGIARINATAGGAVILAAGTSVVDVTKTVQSTVTLTKLGAVDMVTDCNVTDGGANVFEAAIGTEANGDTHMTSTTVADGTSAVEITSLDIALTAAANKNVTLTTSGTGTTTVAGGNIALTAAANKNITLTTSGTGTTTINGTVNITVAGITNQTFNVPNVGTATAIPSFTATTGAVQLFIEGTGVGSGGDGVVGSYAMAVATLARGVATNGAAISVSASGEGALGETFAVTWPVSDVIKIALVGAGALTTTNTSVKVTVVSPP